ncbi:MAG: zinc ribbon domain-containing protein [Promethearchaeota archaeon]
MPKKYGYYVLKSDIDEIWSRNEKFWKEKTGKVIEQAISDNKLHRIFSFKHGASFKLYGFSSGETYTFKLGYLPKEGNTLVSVEIKFNFFGKGAVWKFPNDIMKEWEEFMDIEDVKLHNKKTSQFIEIEQIVDKISNNSEKNLEMHYCPYCGAELRYSEKFCVNCESNT